MYEDSGHFDMAFDCLSRGNAIRKRLLNYSINNDQNLFLQLKKIQPFFANYTLQFKKTSYEVMPIFILGMPRSGTTLVEQIISSHSKVTGLGELDFISRYGIQLAVGNEKVSEASISKFREKYLSELSKVSDGKRFVTDKMPDNFRCIPLIFAALPEAKVVHVREIQRQYVGQISIIISLQMALDIVMIFMM